jgi:hypothetical protein
MNTADTNLMAAGDEELAPELAGLSLAPRGDGPAAAATLAAGFGVFVLGLLTTLAVISASLKGFLEDFQGSVGVGSLAGKTTLAMAAWLVSWAALALVWKGRDVRLRTVALVALVLTILGLIGTFPPFFEAFE